MGHDDQSRRSGGARTAAAVAFGVLPAIVAIVAKGFVAVRPFWIHFYDPETIYFYCSMRLAHGRLPFPVETPGGPLHLLGVPLVLLSGSDPLNFDLFRSLAYATTLVLVVLAAWLARRTVLAALPDDLAAAALCLYFVCPSSLEYLTIWSPESLYLPAGLLLIAAAMHYFERPSWRTACLTGLALGVAISLKFTFSAWAVAFSVAALVAHGWRRAIAASACAAGASIVGFCIGGAAILGNLPAIFESLWKFASHAGVYGSGARSAPRLTEFLINIEEAFNGARLWHAVLLCLLAAGALALFRRSHAALIAFGMTAIVLTYLMSMRYMPQRYLLANGLGAMLLFVAVVSGLRNRAARTAVVLAVALLALKATLTDFAQHERVVAGGVAARQQIHEALGRAGCGGGSIVVYGWRAPEPSFALRMLAFDEQVYRAVERRWPRDGHYNGWKNILHLPAGARDWDCAVVTPDLSGRFDGTATARVAGFDVIAKRESAAVTASP